ncbi:winged helix-turn-helix transcriptional regulator [Sedimentibacter sp. zth1]|uniref:MarR family winged helix-turn-helix transcriptional regulator n=1 Tax=Sedimentibacter sp. zth1 TaxID=2816908 RepID=UPI001A90E264|nr:MarR family winged helix-turn-helix transcriptional regulator [Sedimentibacter sp. zth1]QSX05574.1 winged helix-turn-helix transcriptional regulator [Sedimentibacter sp. zth1]
MENHESINNILVRLFRNILDSEEKCVCSGDFKDLSITEIHIIENIGIGSERNMSDTAKNVKVTSGTLTIAINNLIRKGYVERRRSETDRRVVKIKLTEKGDEAFRLHDSFHVDMVYTVIEGLNDEEQLLLVDVLRNIERHFNKKYM